MARDAEEAPQPDARAGAPHPAEARRLLGHAGAEAEVLAALAGGRVAAGWVIAGPEGVGKATLAYRMAGTLLATPPGAPGPAALGLPEAHPDARLIRAGAHPRLLTLRRGTDDRGSLRQVITVEEARRVRGFLGLSAADGGRRVVVVDAADDLGPSAANALLKLLEEPPRDAHLLLIGHRPARLLPTIRSRCRVLRLAPLASPDLLAVLAGLGIEAEAGLAALSGGSPGRAVTLAADGGLALYGEVVEVLGRLPRLDRPAAIRLAERGGGPGSGPGGGALPLLLDLLDLLLARAARRGAGLPLGPEAVPGEAALLARIAPDLGAARAWAALQQAAGAEARAGRAVNLDPVALLLDMLLRIEETARGAVAA